MNPILEEIKPETAEQLAAQARERGLSVDEYLRSLLPPSNGHTEEQDEETIGQRLKRKGLIGIIDSSQPPDPTSPPHRPPLYDLIADKFRKQGLKLP